MARRISVGVVPGGVGDLTVASATISTRDTNQDLILNPDGTGRVLSNNNLQLQNQSDLRFADADSSNWVAFEAPATVASNVTWTLPSVVGSSGQVFTVGSGGTISWTDKTVNVTNNTNDSTQYNIVFTTASSGTVTGFTTTNTKLQFQPSTGTITVTNIVESSSIVLKENLRPIENALDKILSLQGYSYDRKDGSKKNESGLIAEYVEKIIPDVVSKDDNGNPQAIAYQRLVTYLIESIKELNKEVVILKKIIKE
jgi:hypothetical protein